VFWVWLNLVWFSSLTKPWTSLLTTVTILYFNIIFILHPLCWSRSEKAGKVLADVLLKGLQGNRWHHLMLLQKVDDNVASLCYSLYFKVFCLWSRPVTLVGFSLGARVIFKCLEFLADSKGDNGNLESLQYGYIGNLYRLVYKIYILCLLLQLD
jgi:hypothetical protein